MGKWTRLNLTLDPGTRAPERVAAELNARMRPHLEALTTDRVVTSLFEYGGPSVWAENERVHLSTGRTHCSPRFDLERAFVERLDVPAASACAVWQHETDYSGEVNVFGWVDGGFVQVDHVGGESDYGASAAAFTERLWGVVGRPDSPFATVGTRSFPPPDPTDRTASPPDPSRFSPVASIEEADAAFVADADQDALLSALSAEEPGRRRAAADELYRRVDQGMAAPGLHPAVFRALDDEAARLPAGAVVARLSISTSDLGAALQASDPARRRAAARCCARRSRRVCERNDGVQRGGYTVDDVLPVAHLPAALDDPDPVVRAGAAAAIRRYLIPEPIVASPEYAPHNAFPAGTVDALLACTDDENPRVRANATIAAVRGACEYEQGGDPVAAVNALMDARTDEHATVRDQAAAFLDYSENGLHRRMPDEALPHLLLRLLDAVAHGVDLPEAESILEYAAQFDVRGGEAVWDDIIALGWEAPGSKRVRAFVATVVEEQGVFGAPSGLCEALADGRHPESALRLLVMADCDEALAKTLRESAAAEHAIAIVTRLLEREAPEAGEMLGTLAEVAPTVAADLVPVFDEAFPHDETLRRNPPAGNVVLEYARAGARLVAAGVAVPDALVDRTAAVLRAYFASPDSQQRRTAGAALGRLARTRPDCVPDVFRSLSGDPDDQSWQPLYALVDTHPEAAGDGIAAMVRRFRAALDGENALDPAVFEEHVRRVLIRVAAEAPAVLAPAVPAAVDLLPRIGRMPRERLASALAEAVEEAEAPLAASLDARRCRTLERCLLDFWRDTRRAAGTILTAVDEQGGSLPPVGRAVAGADRDAPGWPLTAVAEAAPTWIDQLVQRTVQRHLVHGSTAPPKGIALLLADVAHVQPTRVVPASGSGLLWMLTDAALGEKEGRAFGRERAMGVKDRETAGRALRRFVDECPDLVSTQTAAAFVQVLVETDAGETTAKEGLVSLAEQDPAFVRSVLTTQLDDPEAALGDDIHGPDVLEAAGIIEPSTTEADASEVADPLDHPEQYHPLQLLLIGGVKFLILAPLALWILFVRFPLLVLWSYVTGSDSS